MKYRWNPRPFRAHLLLLGLFWLTGAMGSILVNPDLAPQDRVLWIVSSSDNPFFQRSIQQIEKRLSDQVGQIISISSDQIESRREGLAHASLIVTLGARAMRQLGGLDLERPMLHAYLTRYQYLTDPPLIDSHSLLLDQPMERVLRFDHLLSGGRRIGLLDSEEAAYNPAELQEKADREGVEVIQKTLRSDHANPVAAVRRLLQQSDNLLAVPSPDIYNRKTLKGILLAAYRLRKPVISYSLSHVRAGALGALYTTPEQIGRQIAELSLNWLQGNPPERPYSLARYFAIEVNQRVAESLDIQLPQLDELQEAIRKLGP